MSIFAGLEKFGFNMDEDEGIDIYGEKEKNKAESSSKAKEIKLEDLVFLKEYKCPCCAKSFQNSTLKQRVVKYVKSDTDLRMHFTPLDPLYYDVILCPNCGYTAVSRMFSRLLPKQSDKIKEKISVNFKPQEYNVLLTLDNAIDRYKMALFNAHIKEGRNGEKAYICLKLAWLYREVSDHVNEKIFLESALKGFTIAFEKDNFPICGLDEMTLTYIMADISRRLGDIDASLRFLGRVVSDTQAPQKIKDKAFELRSIIKEEQAKSTVSDGVAAVSAAPKKKSLLGGLLK